MSHIETLPSKATAGKLLVPLAKKLLATKVFDSRLLTSITFSEKIPSSDREIIIQTAVHSFAKGKKAEHDACGKWLVLGAKEYTEALKSSIAPLIDTLEPGMIIELESLTELTLKVFQ